MARRRDHIQHVFGQWRREAPQLDRSPMTVVTRISRLATLLQTELEAVFAAHGVIAGEFDVLAALRRSGRPYRLTPGELSRALIVTSGGMTRRLRALEARGLVRRDPHAQDGRSKMVSLTAAGRRLVDAILPELVEREQQLVRELGRARRRELANLLETFALTLGDREPARGDRARRGSAAPHP